MDSLSFTWVTDGRRTMRRAVDSLPGRAGQQFYTNLRINQVEKVTAPEETTVLKAGKARKEEKEGKAGKAGKARHALRIRESNVT